MTSYDVSFNQNSQIMFLKNVYQTVSEKSTMFASSPYRRVCDRQNLCVRHYVIREVQLFSNE